MLSKASKKQDKALGMPERHGSNEALQVLFSKMPEGWNGRVVWENGRWVEKYPSHSPVTIVEEINKANKKSQNIPRKLSV